jgi:UDP-3-O-[3-hydroxymyristoyl] glucosamine N-acyltransferase
VSQAGLTAQAVADLVGGRLLGDGTVTVTAVRALDRAGPDAISLAVSPRYGEALRRSRAGAVLVPPALAESPDGPGARIVVRDPYAALVRVMAALAPPLEATPGVDPSARLGPGCVLGPDVSIGPFVVLGRDVRVGARARLAEGVSLGDGVAVGDDSEIGPRAVCYPGTSIGCRVVIKAGAVIGGPGFGSLPGPGGHTRIPHAGRCIVEDEVEIGSNSCVDRGSLDDTVIGRGTKIDNLVHVAHNVRLGERCLLMAGVGIAGSTHIGNDVILAGHVGVTDHLEIGDRVRVAAKSAVFGDIPGGAAVGGHPARAHRQFLRAHAALYRMVPIINQLERLAAATGKAPDA